MAVVAIPVLVYVDTPGHDSKEALAYAQELRAKLDQGVELFDVALALKDLGIREEGFHVDMDAPLAIVEGYNTPRGLTRYDVLLSLSYGDEEQHEEEGDASPGNYAYSVLVRNCYEAIEAAKDEFHTTEPVGNLDDCFLEVVSVRRAGAA